MKIAQVAPLYESVPPKLYGGTERIVHYLTEALVEAGHDVTLYASGDSITSARLVPHGDRALRLGAGYDDALVPHVLMMEHVYRDSAEFDVIHSHVDYLPYSFIRRITTPVITTLHGRLDIFGLHELYEEFSDIPLASISDAQRAPLDWVNWIGTVYHGLPANTYRLVKTTGNYLAFLGRISPEKQVDAAIKIAIAAGLPLKIAAKIDPMDWDYYQREIKPLMDHPLVEYIGEINEQEKCEFLGNALGLLFPIDWPEPFGLVMIEAMACGTPVIARRRGSVPEVIDDGRTGFIFETMEEAVEAVRRISTLDRRVCRKVFEQRFTAGRMCDDYVALYSRMATGVPLERSASQFDG